MTRTIAVLMKYKGYEITKAEVTWFGAPVYWIKQGGLTVTKATSITQAKRWIDWRVQ